MRTLPRQGGGTPGESRGVENERRVVYELFERIIDLPASARAPAVDAIDVAEVRRRLRELLDAYERAAATGVPAPRGAAALRPTLRDFLKRAQT